MTSGNAEANSAISHTFRSHVRLSRPSRRSKFPLDPPNKRSPSLEKTSALEPTAQTESQTRSASLMSRGERLVLLVAFLAFVTFCCFGAAYYLFTTPRWVPIFSMMGATPRLVAISIINTMPPIAYP